MLLELKYIYQSSKSFSLILQIGLLLVLARMYFNLNQTFLPLFLQESVKANEVCITIK